MPNEARLAVLFADVSGSTQMYEALGDVRARGIVARCIAVMTEATHRHGGTLVKTMGDEVMTTFPDAAAAAEAACEMQEAITGQMMVEGRRLAIRVGFHFGPILSEDADVFGDAVNLAARLANQAKSGQILTSGATVAHLTGPRRKSCRQIDLTQVRGKQEQIEIHEVVWRAEDATVMRAPWATEHRAGGRLVFTAGGTRLELGEGHPSLTIGRADQNDLVVVGVEREGKQQCSDEREPFHGGSIVKLSAISRRLSANRVLIRGMRDFVRSPRELCFRKPRDHRRQRSQQAES